MAGQLKEYPFEMAWFDPTGERTHGLSATKQALPSELALD